MTDPEPDEDFDPEELDAAVNDTEASEEAPEIDPSTRDLTTWDEPPHATGGSVERVPLEDEANIAEELVEEGLDVADSEQRISSADPDAEG